MIKHNIPHKASTLLSIIILVIVVALTSCNNYKGGEEIPSYIYIDSIYVETDPSLQGSASSYITDVWVDLNGKDIGTFSLPARIPILAKGKQKISFRAGIMMNQMVGYRVYYPFYKTITKEINLVPDSIIKLGVLKTEYVKDIKFDINEAFESTAFIFDTTPLRGHSKSDVAINNAPYTPAEQLFRPQSLFGLSYMEVKLGVNDTIFECISKDDYFLPKGSANIFIELDYYTENIDLIVGIWSNKYEQVIQQPLFGLKPTNGKWKKAYLCLTPYITNDDTQALRYYIFMAAVKSNNVKEAEIRVDNFKLIKYETN